MWSSHRRDRRINEYLHPRSNDAYHALYDRAWFRIAIWGIYILRSITSTTPATSIDADCWKHLHPLQLADPGFAKPGPIDLLIGADIWGNIIRDGISTGQRNEPCAICTHLGWVVFEPVITNPTFDRPLHTFTVNKCVSEQRLDELLHKFWELEEHETECDPTPDPCEKIFVNCQTQRRRSLQCTNTILSWRRGTGKFSLASAATVLSVGTKTELWFRITNQVCKVYAGICCLKSYGSGGWFSKRSISIILYPASCCHQ